MTVWNDCYNSNPEAAMMMLDLLAATPARRRIAILGEMLELGRSFEDLHPGGRPLRCPMRDFCAHWDSRRCKASGQRRT